LAAEIEKKYQIKPVLIEGKGGVFDVEVDGKVIYSKKKVGRFPDKGEIFSLMEGPPRRK
jgi:selT/selW/selH-like putative selenoprotein